MTEGDGTGYGTYMLRVEGLSRIDNQILSIYGIPGAARLSILNSDGKVLAEAFQGRPSVEATREIPIVYKDRVPRSQLFNLRRPSTIR